MLPAGQNSASFYLSVLNSGYNPGTGPLLPPGQNSANFFLSVLNSGYNPGSGPFLPAGQNSASFDASVLNSGYNPGSGPLLPAGQNSASFYISVCNISSGCAPSAPTIISANGSRSKRPGPTDPAPVSRRIGALPALEPIEGTKSVTAGQTIRLSAQNVDAGSTVEFDVNRTAIATVTEAPYETLFTVPEGLAELTFELLVRTPGQPEQTSQTIAIAVLPDSGANVVGVAQAGEGEAVDLSLAAGGLKEEFFRLAQPAAGLPSLDGLKPVRSGYATAINEPNPRAVFGDDPLGSHLVADYAIRFSGELRAAQTGEYRFWLAARSGSAIWIDGKNAARTGFASGEPTEASVSLALDQGWHSIEVIYYLAVGASSLRLEWQPPNASRRDVLGPEYLRTVLTGTETRPAIDGAFAFSNVPQKFDSVWIRVRRGMGFIEYPALKAGSGPVSIVVPK